MTSIDPTPHHVMSCHVMSKNPFSIKHEGGSRWRGALQVPTVLSYQPHHTYKDYYEKVTEEAQWFSSFEHFHTKSLERNNSLIKTDDPFPQTNVCNILIFTKKRSTCWILPENQFFFSSFFFCPKKQDLVLAKGRRRKKKKRGEGGRREWWRTGVV